jgi:hypothetical protein
MRDLKQGPATPFNMCEVIPRFVVLLRPYHISKVIGDRVGGRHVPR